MRVPARSIIALGNMGTDSTVDQLYQLYGDRAVVRAGLRDLVITAINEIRHR